MSTGNAESAAVELLAVVKKSIRVDAEFAVVRKPDGVSLKSWSIFDPNILKDETKLDAIAACAAIPLLDRGMGSIVGKYLLPLPPPPRMYEIPSSCISSRLEH